MGESTLGRPWDLQRGVFSGSGNVSVKQFFLTHIKSTNKIKLILMMALQIKALHSNALKLTALMRMIDINPLVRSPSNPMVHNFDQKSSLILKLKFSQKELRKHIILKI